MANKINSSPISFREALVIICIFAIILGAILKLMFLFYTGLFVVIVLIIERSLGIVFNPGKSKVNLE